MALVLHRGIQLGIVSLWMRNSQSKGKREGKKKKNERGRGKKISVAVFKRTRQGLRKQSIHYYIYILLIN